MFVSVVACHRPHYNVLHHVDHRKLEEGQRQEMAHHHGHCVSMKIQAAARQHSDSMCFIFEMTTLTVNTQLSVHL